MKTREKKKNNYKRKFLSKMFKYEFNLKNIEKRRYKEGALERKTYWMLYQSKSPFSSLKKLINKNCQ